MPEQADRAVAGEERQRIGLVVSLVILGRYDLEDRTVAGERDVGETTRRDHLAQLHVPFGGDLAGRGGEPRAHPVGDPPWRLGKPRALPLAHARR